MQAIVHHRYGPPTEVMALEEVDDPPVGPGDVLVRTRAAAVNWADCAITTGLPYMVRLPFGVKAPREGVRGTDVAGTVERVGDAVTGLHPGQDVFGWCTGAFAQRVAAPADQLLPVPDGLTFEQAAAVPMAATVALQAFRTVSSTTPARTSRRATSATT